MNPRENKRTKEFVTWSEDSSILIRYVPCQADQLRTAIQLALKSAYIEQLERKPANKKSSPKQDLTEENFAVSR